MTQSGIPTDKSRYLNVATWAEFVVASSTGESLARPVIQKLPAGGHGGEGVAACHNFLVQSVVLERVWRDVGHGLTLRNILIAQLLHVVELVVQQP